MKSIRSFLIVMLIGVSLAANLHLLHAQTAGAGSFNSNLSLVQAAAPDSIIQVTAESAGLIQSDPASLPRSGTFFVIIPGYGGGITALPYPCMTPALAGLPVYGVTANSFIVDDTLGQVFASQQRPGRMMANMTVGAALELQANATLNLINMLQGAQLQTMSRAMDTGGPMPGGGGGGSGTNNLLFTIDYASLTNGLFLELTNIFNGYAWLNLHNATDSGGVYEIFSKTNLSDAAWNIEAALWPTDTNCQPFVLSFNPQSPAFFVTARDWTGVTSGGNSTPEWWFWKYFGTVDLSDSTPDNGGINTLGYDFTNGIDPNIILFSIEATNDYIVNTTTANLQLRITSGAPVYYALFMSGATTTNWLPFTTTNLTVNLGPTDGVYDVVVGLRGLPADATQTWDDYPITLDRVAPMVAISNPILAGGSGTVIKPFLQLQGVANKQLSSLSYDISNAAGLLTNQPGYVTDQYFDPTVFDYTTNSFQCYDVPLTTNDNFITLRVTDRAGNMTTTNFDVVLDYTTATNPVLALTWPQDGMALCGNSFTLRGWVDDETASAVASITDTNGDVTTVSGEVERSGVLWAENLPLNEGTNWVTLSVTNSAGLSSATNIMVVKSDMTLALTSIQGDLWQPPVNVYGTISDTTAAIYVNGVQGTNYGGTWEVDNVPVSASGVASFDVDAIPAGGGDPSINTNVVKAAEIIMVDYQETNTARAQYVTTWPGQWWNETLTESYTNQPYAGTNGQWLKPFQARADYHYAGNNSEGGPYSYDDIYNWTNWTLADATLLEISGGATNYYGPIPEWDSTRLAVPGQDETYASGGDEPTFMTHYYGDVTYHYDLGGGNTEDLAVSAHTQMKLYTGGKAGVNRLNLFCISAGATEYGKPPLDYDGGYDYPWWDTRPTPVDSTRIKALGQSVGADGNLWMALPDNASPDLNLCAPARHYNATATQQKYKLHIVVNGTTPLQADRIVPNAYYCVGQKLNFQAVFSPDVSSSLNYTSPIWNYTADYINNHYTSLYGNCEVYNIAAGVAASNPTTAWFFNKQTKDATANLGLYCKFNNGQSVYLIRQGQFNVYTPTLNGMTNPTGPAYIALYAGLFGTNILSVGTNTGAGELYYKIYVNSKYLGLGGITQLINGYNYGTGDVLHPNDTSGDDWLDNVLWYNPPINVTNATDWTQNPLALGDEPHIRCLRSPAGMQYEFNDYVRFRPDGDSDNIFVTLGIVSWHVNAQATTVNGVWTQDSNNSVTGPTGPDTSNAFPFWDSNFDNSWFY